MTWNYYNYKCLPSNELRGKRPEHDEGYCGRPILRKSKESLPIQGSPCPNCGRRTRINKNNLVYPKPRQGIFTSQQEERFNESKIWSQEFHNDTLREWKEEQNQKRSSIFSNVSEETVEKIEQFAESFEQFVEGVE